MQDATTRLWLIGAAAGVALFACAPAAPKTPEFATPAYEAFVADRFNFDEPAETEARFLALARDEASPEAAAEFLTQAARAQGVQDRLEDAQATLARSGAELAASPRLRARYALERGRLLRRSGDVDGALALFSLAYATALEGGEHALAADAAHMMALASPPEAAQQWVERGLAVALGSDRPVARAWAGTISFNWGGALSERGDHANAALYYARSMAAREKQGDPELVRATELALAHGLALIGSAGQARAILTRLLREVRAAGADAAEIEAELAAVGRGD